MSTFIFIFGLAEHYVILIRRAILYPWDLTQTKLVGNIIGGYKLTIDKFVIISFFLYAAMMILALMKKDMIIKIKYRAVFVLALAIVSVFYSVSFVFNTAYQYSLKIAYSSFSTISDNTQNGVLLTFAHHLLRLEDNKPSDYSKAEAEILLGISMSFFNHGTYPFVRNINRDVEGFASVMNDAGYNSIAIHPFSGFGWNRDSVFSLMGFSEFYTIEDFENPDLIREYITDQSAYDFVIKKYEEQKESNADEPIFEYLITIQNHGGYVSPLLTPEIDVLLDEDYPQAEQYLTLVNESDKALEKLIQYYEQVEDPVVIIFMGDHQPGFTGGFMDYCSENIGDQWLNWFRTPLLIWANYDISESDIVLMTEPYISSNYVFPFLTDIIGIESTPFMNFLRAMNEDMPVINPVAIIDDTGKIVGIEAEEMTPENLNWLEKYAIAQYYLLNDA